MTFNCHEKWHLDVFGVLYSASAERLGVRHSFTLKYWRPPPKLTFNIFRLFQFPSSVSLTIVLHDGVFFPNLCRHVGVKNHSAARNHETIRELAGAHPHALRQTAKKLNV